MATLEKIRKNGPLVAVVIGTALLLFILGDIFRSGSSLFQGSQTAIAEVAGNSIDARDYFNKIQEVENIYKSQGRLDAQGSDMVRTEVWNDMISSVILKAEMHALGLSIENNGYEGISPAEVTDMVNGKNIDPMIRNVFTNQQTGVFNPADVNNFIRQNSKSTNPQAYQQWLQIEKELLKKRINDKYFNLITKGLYITAFEAKQTVKEANTRASIQYIGKSINTIPDSSITVSESELKEYYNNHQYLFEQNVSRDVAYVSFPIVPSVEDSANAKDEINEISIEFRSTTETWEYTRMNSDISINKQFLTSDKIGTPLDTILFNAETGTIYGPYFDNGYWKISKLIEIKEVYDSLKASHILIAKNQQTGDIEQAKIAIDSIKNLIETGTDFKTIATAISQDPGSAANGGDLGWFSEGTMVPAFNEACLNGDINELQVVETDYGVHLIKVTERKHNIRKVQIATVARVLDATEKTRSTIYQQASKFAIESNTWNKFNENIATNNYKKLIARNILPSATRFVNIENAHNLIKGIYVTDKDDIVLNASENNNPVYEEGENYIVAYVTETREKGFATMNSVKFQIENEVKKQKKADLIAIEFEQTKATSLESLGNSLNINVKAANDITYSAFQIPGIGIEPKLSAAVYSTSAQTLSKVIKGNTGVYMFSITNKAEAATDMFGNELSRLNRDLQSRAAYQIYPALEKKANIQDYRYKF
ncbi:MAG: peptidylprolyl isomerase [Bacteroidales bacterium]|nr:peptidylprolyl isomerase [Bacteroidales bacterium]